MSYEILYGRAFIRTSGGIIPLMLQGSSNCTEFIGGREVLERYWTPFWCRCCVVIPEADFEGKIHNTFSGSGEVYRYAGKWLYYRKEGPLPEGTSDFANWMLSGAKKAATLEEYLLANASRPLSLRCSICVYGDNHSFCTDNLVRYCRTNEELDNWLRDAAYYLESLPKADKTSAYYNLDFGTREPLVQPVTGPVVVKEKGGIGYLCSYSTGKSISFSFDIHKAIVFENTADAIQKIGRCWKDIRFVKASPVSDAEVRSFGIYISSGNHAGKWIKKLSRSQLHFTYGYGNQKRFASEAEAKRWMRNTLLPRFPEERIGKCEAREIC